MPIPISSENLIHLSKMVLIKIFILDLGNKLFKHI